MQDGAAFPAASTFGVARWARRLAVLFVPVFAALFGWIGWEMVQDRLAGKGWESAGHFAFVLGTLAALILLFVLAAAWALRARLTLDREGLTLRGIFRTRVIPWRRIEGYRVRDGQLFAYPEEDQLPLHLAHFENQELLHAWLHGHLPDLAEKERASDEREIRQDLELGITEGEKAARLAGLRRVVRVINWTGYAAAAVGGVNAFVFDHPTVQLVAAWALIPVPVALVIVALRHRRQMRLDYREGSPYPEGLTGILAASIALGLMSIMDNHTLLDTEGFYQWTFGVTVVAAATWLYLEWERIRAQPRKVMVALHVLSLVFLSGFWAGGAVYQLNKNSDVSEPAWHATHVLRLRETRDRTGSVYHAEVSLNGPVELQVSRATFDTLHAGAAVEISVRGGALEIAWVDEVRLKPRPGR